MVAISINVKESSNSDQPGNSSGNPCEAREPNIVAVYPRKRFCNLSHVLFIMIMIVMGMGLISLWRHEKRGHKDSEEPHHEQWVAFKEKYGKVYNNSNHEAIHKQNFVNNVKDIKEHNQNFVAGLSIYKKELNQFSDQDPSTFNRIRNGLKLPENWVPPTPAELPAIREIPTSVDWREKGMVSHVKNQGQCGSCWAFSATGALESQMLIKSQNTTTLSEEQLVDCDSTDHGCEGGFYTYAWDYVKNAGGLESDSTYPYRAGSTGNPGSCHFDASRVVVKVSGYNFVRTDVSSIMQTLAAVGPLSIAVNAEDFQHYSSGIISCRSAQIDHGILLVGYGTENGEDYWWIKNSWGADWGLDGYAKLTRGVNSDCGLSKHAFYPIIA